MHKIRRKKRNNQHKIMKMPVIVCKNWIKIHLTLILILENGQTREQDHI